MKNLKKFKNLKKSKTIEHEENTPDKHINKDYQQGEMYITNKDLTRKAMQDEYDAKMKENVATVSAGNVSGMGAVVTATPSSTPGQTTGSGFSTPVAGDSYGNGGTVGSGDIGSGWSKNKKNNRKRNKNKKTKSTDITKKYGTDINNTFDIKNYKQGGNIKSFSEYSKTKKKYLKTIYESIGERDRMILATYKNAIANNNETLFYDIRRKYGMNVDLIVELVYYCIVELKDLNQLKFLFNLESGAMNEYLHNVWYDEFIEELFNNIWDNNDSDAWWNIHGLMFISKEGNFFKVSFQDDFEPEYEEEDMKIIINLHNKIRKNLNINLDTGGLFVNSLDYEDGIRLLLFLFKDEDVGGDDGGPFIFDIEKESIKDIIMDININTQEEDEE